MGVEGAPFNRTNKISGREKRVLLHEMSVCNLDIIEVIIITPAGENNTSTNSWNLLRLLLLSFTFRIVLK